MLCLQGYLSKYTTEFPNRQTEKETVEASASQTESKGSQ